MDALSRILFALAVTIVAAALAWGAREISENGRYSLSDGGAGAMYLTDSKTGRVWAHWVEKTPDGRSFMKQGFSLVERHGSMRGSLEAPAESVGP